VTERPEAIEAGAARLVGTATQGIIAEVTRLLDDPAGRDAMAQVRNPFGDGRAAERIVSLLCSTDPMKLDRSSGGPVRA
jgi:UDP-N-acetylglucosamine 2-epimerase (non-hydrolysing)